MGQFGGGTGGGLGGGLGGGPGGGLGGGGGETVGGSGAGGSGASEADRSEMRPRFVPGGRDEARSGDGPETSDELAQLREREAEQAARIGALEAELDAAREALRASERRRVIDLALGGGDVVDVETASLLVEMEVIEAGEDELAEAVRGAVERLRSSKAFLFRRGGRDRAGGERSGAGPGAGSATGSATGSAALERAPVRERLGSLASSARSSGDRAELLRYLRERRGA